jgi:hypothetical protein
MIPKSSLIGVSAKATDPESGRNSCAVNASAEAYQHGLLIQKTTDRQDKPMCTCSNVKIMNV